MMTAIENNAYSWFRRKQLWVLTGKRDQSTDHRTSDQNKTTMTSPMTQSRNEKKKKKLGEGHVLQNQRRVKNCECGNEWFRRSISARESQSGNSTIEQ
jgi:hypothetical protein